MSDPLMRLLSELPAGEPDAPRADQIRLRCRFRISRNAPRASKAKRTLAAVWRPAIAILGAAYLIAAIVEATRIYRLA